MRGTKGGEKGGLGRAEILKSETLMGRMLRSTPEFGVSGELTLIFITFTLALPAVLPRFILFVFVWRRLIFGWGNRRDARAPLSAGFGNKTRPSSKRISGAFPSGVWANQSGMVLMDYGGGRTNRDTVRAYCMLLSANSHGIPCYCKRQTNILSYFGH